MTTLLQKADRQLRSQGGRMTSQRRIILEALDCLNCHPTAEEVYDTVKLRDQSINLSTVYRTLRWLEQEGLISARRFAEDGRQDRFDPMLPSEHYHFLCTECKEVIEFDHPAIESICSSFEQNSRAAVQSVSFVLYGLCPNCQSRRKN
jgi:Fe2+ or Zn2+ uptake regulation protein